MKTLLKNKHKYLTWFWAANFPICLVLYLTLDEKIMGLYIALCSIYANVESSAGAKNSKEAIEK